MARPGDFSMPNIADASELFWEWNMSCAESSVADGTAITYSMDNQESSRKSSRALLIPEDASPPESPARSTRGPVRKDAEKRREQNRAAQRAYRDRQKILVDGLLTQVEELSVQLKQQSTKCELLESMCKRLATENDVSQEFLKLGRTNQ